MKWTIACAAALLTTACIDFSPYDVDPIDRDRTGQNLEKLRALPEPEGPWTIALLADSQGHPEQLEDIIDRIHAREDVTFVLHGGDITDFGTQVEYNWVTEELDRLSVPVFTAIGNHDALANGTRIYEITFGPLDYAFIHGGLKFIMLNNNALEFKGGVPDYDWLENELRTLGEARAAVIVMHIPPGSPEFPDRERFEHLITSYPVLGVLSGHVNDHSILSHDGVPIYSVDAIGRGGWSLVTFDDMAMHVQFCNDDACEPGFALDDKR